MKMSSIERHNPQGMPAEASVREWTELCRYLGGSPNSWTGLCLTLIAKSDRAHLRALREAVPLHVAAWEIWTSHHSATLTVAELDVMIEYLR